MPLRFTPIKFINLWERGLIGQKEHKTKLIFFFKEEDNEANQALETLHPPFEVNLINSQDFVCSQNKDNENVPRQIDTF